MKAVVLQLLQEPWGELQPMVDEFLNSRYYPMLEGALAELNREALFKSKVHGSGHIERTLCHGAIAAMEEALSPEDTRLLLLSCAYHDVGRENDKLDDLHGHRSAQRMAALTGLTGEELKLVQGAVDAHSRSDREMVSTVESYAPADLSRALKLAVLLKDADGLDRVRIWDLNPEYLRRESSRSWEDFAKELFRRYQLATGGEYVMDFVRKWKHLDENGNPVKE